MKTEVKIGLAVGGGYLLGRFHKLKWALALATMAGRKRLAGAAGGGGLLSQGAKLISSSPQLSKLTEEVRGGLIDAGKAAAVAAVSSRIDMLSDSLRDRGESLRAGGKPAGDDDEAGHAQEEPDERSDDEEDAGQGEDGKAQRRQRSAPRGEGGRAGGAKAAKRRPAARKSGARPGGSHARGGSR